MFGDLSVSAFSRTGAVQLAHEGWAAQSCREASSLMHWAAGGPSAPSYRLSRASGLMTHRLSALLPGWQGVLLMDFGHPFQDKGPWGLGGGGGGDLYSQIGKTKSFWINDLVSDGDCTPMSSPPS